MMTIMHDRSTAQNPGDAYKQLARTLYEAFNTGDTTALDRAFVPDWLDHMRPPNRSPGLAGLKETIADTRHAFPDYHITIEAMLVEGDIVSVRSTLQGTHQQAFMGIPATNKIITFTAFDMHHIRNSQIVESWHLEDKLSLLQQMGFMPQIGESSRSNKETVIISSDERV